MRVIYKGDYPIKFISIEGGAKLIYPGDVIEMSDKLYNSEYSKDPRFEGSVKKKKGEE